MEYQYLNGLKGLGTIALLLARHNIAEILQKQFGENDRFKEIPSMYYLLNDTGLIYMSLGISAFISTIKYFKSGDDNYLLSAAFKKYFRLVLPYWALQTFLFTLQGKNVGSVRFEHSDYCIDNV